MWKSQGEAMVWPPQENTLCHSALCPHWKGWELGSTSLKGWISYINYLESSWDTYLFSIYLFSHLFMLVQIHRYLFYTLGYNLILLYFFFLLKLFQFWSLSTLSVWPCVPLTPISADYLLLFCFQALPYFLLPWDILSLSRMFPALVLE